MSVHTFPVSEGESVDLHIQSCLPAEARTPNPTILTISAALPDPQLSESWITSTLWKHRPR